MYAMVVADRGELSRVKGVSIVIQIALRFSLETRPNIRTPGGIYERPDPHKRIRLKDQILDELKGGRSSPRELQVLGLMAKAHSNRAIAEALFIQPRTVEHRISSVLAKLGFNSNGERHGRVFAILTYLESTGQLPVHDSELELGSEFVSPMQMIA